MGGLNVESVDSTVAQGAVGPSSVGAAAVTSGPILRAVGTERSSQRLERSGRGSGEVAFSLCAPGAAGETRICFGLFGERRGDQPSVTLAFRPGLTAAQVDELGEIMRRRECRIGFFERLGGECRVEPAGQWFSVTEFWLHSKWRFDGVSVRGAMGGVSHFSTGGK